MTRTRIALVLLISFVGTVGTSAQFMARKKAEPPARVVYRPTGAAIGAMSVEAAALALFSSTRERVSLAVDACLKTAPALLKPESPRTHISIEDWLEIALPSGQETQ